MGAALAILAPALPADRDRGWPAPAPQVLAAHRSSHSRVIVSTDHEPSVEALVARLGGRTVRRLPTIRAVVAELPDIQLSRLTAAPAVKAVIPDRPVAGTLEHTSAAIGTRWINDQLGLDGSGIGVAIIDSGVTAAHDDLDGSRVVHFADFVGAQAGLHDGYGHGTHVAGIIAGNGSASDGTRRGMAPGAHLVVLKALDDEGHGYISNAIAALEYAIEHRTAYNIRVINLSVAAGVYESYRTDPLTLAAGRAVDAGIVVVTSAGNLGRDARGRLQYGGITAPGNAPWVLTVGAASHNGTADRADDTVAPFSSRGPSSIDLVAKPDLVAPGVGIESLADPASLLFATRPDARLWGTSPAEQEPYLSLSGTSMAAPVVTGTVALVLQANPALRPDAVKALLQATADASGAYSQMAQGAGFLNARAAVELAQAFATEPATGKLLDTLVSAYAPVEGPQAAGCPRSDAACTDRRLTAACPVAPGCSGALAGSVTGVAARSVEAVLWHRPADRTGRRRPRRARRLEDTRQVTQ